MMQSVHFLMQHAKELSVLMDGIIIVLLLVILHRIKELLKCIRRENECTRKSVREQMLSEKEEEPPKEAVGQAETSAMENAQTQTELLTAVLDEVFL